MRVLTGPQDPPSLMNGSLECVGAEEDFGVLKTWIEERCFELYFRILVTLFF